jgi:hypothetical protein
MVDEGGFAEHRSFDRHGFDLSAPARVLLGAEQRIGVQVRPLLVEARRKVNLGVWVELGREAGVYVVKEARRDDVRNISQRIDLAFERLVDRNRGVDEQAPVAETHHGHPGAKL